jgi:hypothetical protein
MSQEMQDLKDAYSVLNAYWARATGMPFFINSIILNAQKYIENEMKSLLPFENN